MKGEVKTKFGTYTMETRNSTKISTDKLDVFVKRLKKKSGWVHHHLSNNFVVLLKLPILDY